MNIGDFQKLSRGVGGEGDGIRMLMCCNHRRSTPHATMTPLHLQFRCRTPEQRTPRAMMTPLHLLFKCWTPEQRTKQLIEQIIMSAD
jgi:hypothetical protein